MEFNCVSLELSQPVTVARIKQRPNEKVTIIIIDVSHPCPVWICIQLWRYGTVRNLLRNLISPTYSTLVLHIWYTLTQRSLVRALLSPQRNLQPP
jgi:hypothetical protein